MSADSDAVLLQRMVDAARAYSDKGIQFALAGTGKFLGEGENQYKERKKVNKVKQSTKEKEPLVRKAEFVHEGTKIILPVDMDYREAIDHLYLKAKEEETVVAINEQVEAFPLDGCHALMCVLQNRYGWASPKPTPGFFKDNPPVMVNLETDYGVFTQVIWGRFAMPAIEGFISTGATHNSAGQWVFVMTGEVKKKHQDEVKRLAQEVREYVKANSVYKGKAIRLRTNDDGEVQMESPPTFLDLSNVKENELVLPDSVMSQVRTSVFTPIEQTEACRTYKIPLKRGICLAGPYGTGKTLTAYVTAKKCIQNRWTFIYLDRVAGLNEAIQFSKQYAPAVIFAEDIDRAVSGEERTVEMDDVLNSIDGIESKHSEIMTILTSNHVDRVNRAMLRPGRLDAVIEFVPPDAKAAEALMRLYARGLIAPDADLSAAGEELSGKIPAVIREVVERSKLYAISRTGGQSISLAGEDLAAAARGMSTHLALMSEKVEVVETAEAALGSSFGRLVQDVLGTNGSGSKLSHKLDKVQEKLNELAH